MRFVVRRAAAQGKATAFGMVRNAHVLFGRILGERRLTNDANFVACQVAIQVGIGMLVNDSFATAYSRRPFVLLLKGRKEVCDRTEIRHGIATGGFRRQ